MNGEHHPTTEQQAFATGLQFFSCDVHPMIQVQESCPWCEINRLRWQMKVNAKSVSTGAPEVESTSDYYDAWTACVSALGEGNPRFLSGASNGIGCAVMEIKRLQKLAGLCP